MSELDPTENGPYAKRFYRERDADVNASYTLRKDARDANCTKCRELKICRTVDEDHAIHRLCAECFREFSEGRSGEKQ